jgi:hypothetical protein
MAATCRDDRACADRDACPWAPFLGADQKDDWVRRVHLDRPDHRDANHKDADRDRRWDAAGESADRGAGRNEVRLDRCRELCRAPGHDFLPEAEDAKAAVDEAYRELKTRLQRDALHQAVDRVAADAVSSDARLLDRAAADELAGRVLHRDEVVARGQDAARQESLGLEPEELREQLVLQRQERQEPELARQRALERRARAASEQLLELPELEWRPERSRQGEQLGLQLEAPLRAQQA